LKRTVEPELMLDPEQCLQYYKAYRQPIFDLVLRLLPEIHGTVVDLGCGPGELEKVLIEKFPDIKVHGYDGSKEMLNLANKHLSNNNVEFIHNTFDKINTTYNFIISVNTLHHIHNPSIFWQSIKRMSTTDTKILVIDLIRPNKESDIESILNDTIVNNDYENYLFKEDYKNSLKAAFNEQELIEQIADSGLSLTKIKLPNTILTLAIIKNYG